MSEASEKLRIILAEDDESYLLTVRTLLEDQLGHRVISVVKSGQELISRYKEYKAETDLIVTDHIMPGMTGLEAASRVNKIRFVPVLFISATDPGLDQREYVADFVEKPVDVKELGRAITHLMQNFRVALKMHQEQKLLDAAHLIMAQDWGLSETDAHQWIRSQSIKHRIEKEIVANIIVDYDSLGHPPPRSKSAPP